MLNANKVVGKDAVWREGREGNGLRFATSSCKGVQLYQNKENTTAMKSRGYFFIKKLTKFAEKC